MARGPRVTTCCSVAKLNAFVKYHDTVRDSFVQVVRHSFGHFSSVKACRWSAHIMRTSYVSWHSSWLMSAKISWLIWLVTRERLHVVGPRRSCTFHMYHDTVRGSYVWFVTHMVRDSRVIACCWSTHIIRISCKSRHSSWRICAYSWWLI